MAIELKVKLYFKLLAFINSVLIYQAPLITGHYVKCWSSKSDQDTFLAFLKLITSNCLPMGPTFSLSYNTEQVLSFLCMLVIQLSHGFTGVSYPNKTSCFFNSSYKSGILPLDTFYFISLPIRNGTPNQTLLLPMWSWPQAIGRLNAMSVPWAYCIYFDFSWQGCLMFTLWITEATKVSYGW